MKHILVIKLGALGDFIQALGAMRAIREYHPNSKITLLTTKPYAALAEKSGYIDHIWIDELPKWFQPYKWLAQRNKLNDGNFSRIYDLQNNDRTGLYFKLFSSKPEWVGIAKGASHRNTSPERTAGLAFEGHVQTLGLAGIKNIGIDDLGWLISDIAHFSLPENYALIVPGSAPKRPEKRWPARHYAALCRDLYEKKIMPVLIGTDAEKDVMEHIKRGCPHVTDLSGQTKLEDLPALARHTQFAIGNDTGPMHMIGPTGCKTFVLFSAHSKPHRHAPLGENVQTIQKSNLENLSVERVLGLLPK
ncbi:MAG: glycosyltransferase family 9 protein [Alphaproteobacteria bacterium]|nr:glycosyltransferase family 9 protein [Alphaproteobacteria bacterium]